MPFSRFLKGRAAKEELVSVGDPRLEGWETVSTFERAGDRGGVARSTPSFGSRSELRGGSASGSLRARRYLPGRPPGPSGREPLRSSTISIEAKLMGCTDMPNAAIARSYGTVFNEIAGEYDRHRPAYPDALIDQACAAGRSRGPARRYSRDRVRHRPASSALAACPRPAGDRDRTR